MIRIIGVNEHTEIEDEHLYDKGKLTVCGNCNEIMELVVTDEVITYDQWLGSDDDYLKGHRIKQYEMFSKCQDNDRVYHACTKCPSIKRVK